MKLSDLKYDSLRVLTKGRPKTRKTTSILSWPGRHYVFLFDPDGIRPALKHFPDRMDKIEFDYYHPGNLAEADAKMRSLIEHNPYDNISIDSLTFGGQTSMDYGLNTAKNVDLVGFVRMPGQREYGVEHNYMMGLISACMRLSANKTKPCNFFLSAHVMERQMFSPDGKLLRTKQRLVSGGQALAEKILAQFKEVWHFEDESSIEVGKPKTYKVYTQTLGENIASTDLPIPKEFDITNNWLYDKFSEAMNKK